ncbi:peptidase M20/M25/M40 family protein [Bordetella holmesii 44057]|nr:peptidase M20/M25/M40 family protein [Bordetella holmesii 44057]
MTTLPTTQELIAEIQTWVQCESPSHYVEGITAMAHLAAERPGILIIGHIDTVHPVGTLTENPCRIEDDRLYGPGSYDMKAGIVLALAGLRGLTEPGAARLPIDFLMVPDEETGSHASREHIEHLAKQAKYGLMCEPARPNGGKCVTARKGTGMLRLGVTGRPAHAGMSHEKGGSAIREMAHQILALENMTDYARGVTISVGTIAGGTVTNTVPAQCRCVVDFRVPDMGAAKDVLSRMRQLCAVGPTSSWTSMSSLTARRWSRRPSRPLCWHRHKVTPTRPASRSKTRP